MAEFLHKYLLALLLSFAGMATSNSAVAETSNSKIGIVLMHGKGGTPTKYIADLVNPLEEQGILVANLEMPWSGRREYDVTVQGAEAEVEAALSSLRSKGARKLFVAGLSQGGLFALYFGAKHAVDGVIAIAPGGSVGSAIFREKLGEYVGMARRLIAEGKGEEKMRLSDFEGSKGAYPIVTAPSIYLTWFDPDGAMNQVKAVQAMNPAIPVLYVAPTRDYPGLLKVKQQMFDALPKNPRTKLYEPDATHLGSPSASFKEIINWTSAVADAR